MEKTMKWLFTSGDGFSFKFGSPLEITGPPALIIVVSVVFICTMIWVYTDAHGRGKNPIIALLFLTLITWPLSLLWWLWLRPERINKSIDQCHEKGMNEP